MVRPRAALGADEVVPALPRVDVRPFDPDGFRRDIDTAVDEHLPFADGLAGRKVELLDPDGAMAVVERGFFGRSVVEYVNAAVVVEEKRRVDAVDARQPDRVGPGAGRVFRGDVVIAAV